MKRSSVFSLLLLYFLDASLCRADERVDYLRNVKPILTARCFACHGALKQKSGLRVDTVDFLKKGGESGAAIVPKNSGKSLLIAHITAAGNASRMPPNSEGDGLKPPEIAAIASWIDDGAIGPPDERPDTDPKDHWAFKAPVRSALPKSEARNPIDKFLNAEMEKKGLKPRHAADHRLLLRRLYLDLIGLPPTAKQQEAFLADSSADAYEKVVDQLLRSPQYGERWGRHWMDVWRYSDFWGLGAEVRNSQKHMWHWRDWIIESLNADKGYDQMVREMLAADELYPTDEDKLRGTGYLARSYFIFNRNSWLEEVVEHSSKAFLGLTMNCSKCHDHKYDPIAQEDFYRMRAFFEPYQVRLDMSKGDLSYEKDGTPRVFDCNLDAPTYLFVRGDEKNPRKDRVMAPGIPEILAFEKLKISPVNLPAEAYNPGLRAIVLENRLREADRQIALAREALDKSRKTLADLEKKAKDVSTVQASTPKSIVKDNFAKENPELWEMQTGKWKYDGGKLAQSQDGSTRAVLKLKQAAPSDFQAVLKFVPTGGQMWKSVGLTFDSNKGNDVLVYVSAVNGGSKLQVAYKQGADYLYPSDGFQGRVVTLNQPQELTIRVRGTLINASVNGDQVLAFRLPIPRQNGNMEIIAFDATAHFTSFELSGLPDNVKLLEPGKSAAGSTPASTTPEQAKLAVGVAEKSLMLAELQPALWKARGAADRATSLQPAPKDAKELALAAARLERQASLLSAEEAVARNELEIAQATGPKKAEAEKKRPALLEALKKAKKDLESPGSNYTSLRGAQKTPENNLESQTSRDKPFPSTSTGRRSALAQWLTDPRHPLTARVAVNHIWARHFGKPLVNTVFDFGRKGALPTHPELLDYLAVELRETNWSMKQLHRLIVTSDAYRRTSSSAGATTNATIDPENRYYWRMNPARMEAEVIRDSLLHLAGELNLKLGGPPIPLNDETAGRRSLYFVHSHNDRHRFLSIFDDANVLECYRRDTSIIPQQSLALENSLLAMSSAEKIAARITIKEDKAFLKAAFELILGSSPTADELMECEKAFKEFQEIATREKNPNSTGRARVNFIHALLNHNDFLTIR
jgi:mono/diheme cytochrome c family protein